jgi:hypothetical protein
MTETKRKKYLYICLLGAVAFGLYNFANPRKPYTPGSGQGADTTSQIQQASINFAKKVDTAAYQALPWGSDPFRRQNTHSDAPRRIEVRDQEPIPVWRLTGIIYNANLPLAVVNGKTVGIGDIIDQAKIVTIDRSKVLLQYRGNQIELRVTKG